MSVLVTGAAGFIGYSLTQRCFLGGQRDRVDVVNDYYDVRLKEARLAKLAVAGKNAPGPERFTFLRQDVAEIGAKKAALLLMNQICTFPKLATGRKCASRY